MTFSRLHITIFLGLAVTAWACVLWIKGTPASWSHFSPFGSVIATLVIAGLLLEYVLWRQRWLHGWFVKRPDLRGTWRVELQSDCIDPKTGEPPPPIVCYMGVAQTLSKLQMHFMTPESESWFIADRILPSPSGKGYQIVGIYTNKPRMHLRGNRSEMHHGALILDTHGSVAKPETMTGEYWTDRKTTGRMTFNGRLNRVFTRYEDAEQGFNA